MFIFQMLKRLLDWVTGIVNQIVYRFEKKSDNPRGYAFGGPRRVKQFLVFFLLSIVGTVVTTIAVQRGVLTSVNDIVDRETAPGAKLPTDISGAADRRDFLRLESEMVQSANAVDCDRILQNLRLRGTLTEREKMDFDRACRQKFGKEMSEIIDKLVSGEIPSTAVADIINSVTPDNAANVLKALESDEVRKALRSDAASDIAKNLTTLGQLTDKEREQAVAAIRAAPPQFRQNVVDAVKSVAAIESPEARGALLNVLEKARTAEELKDVKDFADTIAQAKPEEQTVFAKAYEKAPDAGTRRELARAAKEIVQIPEDDPVRGKLVDLVRQVSELPPEKQQLAYGKIADVANVYRTTDDPDLKRALGDAIMAARSPDDIIALAGRLDDLKQAEKVGDVPKELALAVIGGKDPEAANRLAAVAELARTGDTETAKRVLAGDIDPQDLPNVLRQAEERRGGNEAAPRPGGEATKEQLQRAIDEKRQIEQRRGDVGDKIRSLLASGMDPGDRRVVDLYGEAGALDRDLASKSDEIRKLREALKARLADLRRRASQDFAAAGVALPELDFVIPDDAVEKAAPDERLTDLKNYKEFWSSEDGSYRRKSRRYFNFNVGDGAAPNAGPAGKGTLLSKLAQGGGKDGWFIAPPGVTSGGQGAAGGEFEISRTVSIPGILRRLPSGGIPSAKAAQQTILFEFAVSVANRKTGRIEIPQGSVAICRVKDVDQETARLNATCNAVDTGGSKDITVNLALGDALGVDGVLGKITDNRGWQLAGIFLTAFSAGILDAFSAQVVAPYEQRATKAAGDYVVIGAGGGASAILQDVADKQIEEWQKASVFWHGYDGMLATVRQN